MPTRLKRYYGHDHLHFLTCSCYHRQPWLAQPRRRWSLACCSLIFGVILSGAAFQAERRISRESKP